MHPNRYQVLYKAVLAARGNRREVISKIADSVRAALPAAGIEAEVTGREKTLFGIYRKMVDQKKSFSDVLDIYGFRVIVHTLPECYLALGTLHQLYRPVPGKFKDYIAIPKVNGYQSLHTTLVGPYGTPVEFQFRTRDMHHVAEEGVASHWLYKGADLTSTTCRSALTSGCNRCWTSKARPAIPASSWSTSRSTCSPTLSMCSPRAARSSRCRAAPRRWTSPTRFTPTSATRPWPPRSTASSCRCAPK